MDSAIATAARALAVGDPLTALKHVALRSDPPALALRGISMAQLGELSHARTLLKRAGRGFGDQDPVAQARCVVAQAEVALALRDLSGAARGLDDAVSLLAKRGDVANAVFARLVQVRRWLLLGEVGAAERALGRLSLSGAPARLAAVAGLCVVDLALKRGDASQAEQALEAARGFVMAARIPSLLTELESARKRLHAPVARLCDETGERPVRLDELPALFGAGRLVVDACRREARLGKNAVKLVSRPLLFELLVAVAEHGAEGAPRDVLIAGVFGARRVNESHRVRLRVEIGRLRRLLGRLAELVATPAGFALVPRGGAACCVLRPPADGEASALLALLRSGEG
jgi:hypothetical protein